MAEQVKYRILRPSDLVQYGDERWDFELGWVKVKDSHLERFSREYRRAGAQAWRFRRPLKAMHLSPGPETSPAGSRAREWGD